MLCLMSMVTNDDHGGAGARLHHVVLHGVVFPNITGGGVGDGQ